MLTNPFSCKFLCTFYCFDLFCQKELHVPQEEIMCYNNIIAALFSLIAVVVSEEIYPAIDHAYRYPEVITYTIGFSLVNYFSVSFILLLIEHFGSAEAEIAKSIRKVASITLSFIIFSKPITRNHYLGGFLFLCTILFGIHLKRTAIAAKSSSSTKSKSNTKSKKSKKQSISPKTPTLKSRNGHLKA